MTAFDIADALHAQDVLGDLADIYFAPAPDAALAILCEQVRRDCPEQAIEATIDLLITLGRHSAATIAPASRTLH